MQLRRQEQWHIGHRVAAFIPHTFGLSPGLHESEKDVACVVLLPFELIEDACYHGEGGPTAEILWLGF